MHPVSVHSSSLPRISSCPPVVLSIGEATGLGLLASSDECKYEACMDGKQSAGNIYIAS